MLHYAQWAFTGLFVAGLILAGWTANGWRLRAAQAEGYRLELRNELQRRVAADAKRLTLQRQLETAQAQVVERVKIVKQTVTKYVPAPNPACDLPDPVASQLQRLRTGDDVPAAPDGLADAGSATGDAR
jgi:hypothetical protein